MAITRAASGKSDQVSQCTAGQFVYFAAPYWRTEGGGGGGIYIFLC